jgi:hypothetical protein
VCGQRDLLDRPGHSRNISGCISSRSHFSGSHVRDIVARHARSSTGPSPSALLSLSELRVAHLRAT